MNLSNLPDELLVNILCQVPVECRVRIRTVSQKWDRIIIDLGFHVEPISLPSESHCYLQYPRKLRIKLNPAISSLCKTGDHGASSSSLSEHISNSTRDKLLTKRSEFISSPPISMVGITIWGPESRNRFSQAGIHSQMRTTFYGIRVGDLIDVMNDMEAALPGEIGSKRVDAWTMRQPEVPIRFWALKPEMGIDGVEVCYWHDQWPPAQDLWLGGRRYTSPNTWL